jgi:hypothetical protein
MIYKVADGTNSGLIWITIFRWLRVRILIRSMVKNDDIKSDTWLIAAHSLQAIPQYWDGATNGVPSPIECLDFYGVLSLWFSISLIAVGIGRVELIDESPSCNLVKQFVIPKLQIESSTKQSNGNKG